MADVKFHCPECDQRIAIDDAARGIGIECPICGTLVMLPPAGSTPIRILVARPSGSPSASAVSGSASKAAPGPESTQRAAELKALKRYAEIYERRSAQQLEQLAALTKQRNLFENDARVKTGEVKKLKKEIESVNARLRELEKELEANRQQLAALTGLASTQPKAPESRAETGSDLASLRAGLAEVTKERNEERAKMEGLEETLQKTRDALNAAQLQSTRDKLEAMAAANRNELALAVERSRVEAFLASVRDLEKSLQSARPAAGAANAESSENDPSKEELWRKLTAASERLRSLKNARFTLREKLAGIESAPNPPTGKAAVDLPEENKENLLRRLEELGSETESARSEYERVHAQYQETFGGIDSTMALIPAAVPARNQKDEASKSPPEVPASQVEDSRPAPSE